MVEADDLLDQLGRHVRDPSRPAADDPIWDRLARGELDEAEEAGLRERAANDPEIATLYEAFRPLDAAARQRIVARVEARPRPSRPAWRTGTLIGFIGGPLAAAAAALLVLSHRSTVPGADALPDYTLAVTGGDRPTRSAAPSEAGPVELRRGSHLEVVLRPATAVKTTIVVHAFLLQGPDARPWAVPMDRSPDGSVRISGDAGTLLGVPPGPWDLAFAVTAEGAPAPDAADVTRAIHGDSAPHPWRLLETHVRLVDAE